MGVPFRQGSARIPVGSPTAVQPGWEDRGVQTLDHRVPEIADLREIRAVVGMRAFPAARPVMACQRGIESRRLVADRWCLTQPVHSAEVRPMVPLSAR